MLPKYIDALCQELSWVGQNHGDGVEIDSIYFGGGTPTMYPPEQLGALLDQVGRSFTIQKDCEISLEANPGTISAESVNSLKQLGFNRISFGMQSTHPQDLAILDRRHQFADVVNAVKWSQQAGFEHINVDLIFGIPGQTVERWQQNLTLVAQMGVDHLSLYSLILEEGTPLNTWYQRGLLDLIDDDVTADMYEAAMDQLPLAGFTHYEISNWARINADGKDGRSRHNLNTWRYQPYFGIGAGAHGFTGGIRTANVVQILDYINRTENIRSDWPAAETCTGISVWEQMQEWMMLGLRVVNEGVSKEEFHVRFGEPIEKAFGTQIQKLIAMGLLEIWDTADEHLRLTRKGIMLGNRVFGEFVGNATPDFLAEDQ